MRDIAISILIPLAFILGLTSLKRAMMAFAWITFMRPYDFSWGMWNTLPSFKIALAVGMVSAIMHGGWKMSRNPFLWVYMLFIFWLAITCITSINATHSWDYYKNFILSFWFVAPFVFGVLENLDRLKWTMLISAGSIVLLGAKVGLMLGMKGGGHITDQINGFVGDNNVFGLTLVLAIAGFMGAKPALAKSKFRFAFYPVIIGAFLAVIFTKSRGAFLTLGVIFIISALNSKKPIRNTLILFGLSYLGYTAIPDTFFERLDTLNNIEEDDSAMHRILYWGFAFEISKLYPIFGIGLDNFKSYTYHVYSAELEGRFSQVVHNVYLQVLSESGYVGGLLFVIMLVWTLFTLHSLFRRTKTLKQEHPDLEWVNTSAYWMRNGFLGYMFGSTFLNMLVFDYPWYFMWYAHLLGPALDIELARRRRKAVLRASNLERPPSRSETDEISRPPPD